MSDSVENIVAQLEQDKRVAEELLFLVLDYIDEPVVLNIEESKKRISNDRVVDIEFTPEEGTVTLQVAEVPTRAVE